MFQLSEEDEQARQELERRAAAWKEIGLGWNRCKSRLRKELESRFPDRQSLSAEAFSDLEASFIAVGLQGEFYRAHPRRWLPTESEDFYKVFLERRHSWEASNRFAGTRINSGFFLSCSAHVALAEVLHYYEIPEAATLSVRDALPALHHRQQEHVMLKVMLDIPFVVDFRVPWIVRAILCKLFKVRYEPSLALVWLLRILDKFDGGDELTDRVGLYLAQEGYSGIVFPSVRMTSTGERYGSPPGSYCRQDIDAASEYYGKGAEEVGLAQSLEAQLATEFNVVFFNGSDLCRSISQYSLNEGGGFSDPVPNPWYRRSPGALERKRLRERQRAGLSTAQAVDAGLLSDREIRKHLFSREIWMKSP